MQLNIPYGVKCNKQIVLKYNIHQKSSIYQSQSFVCHHVNHNDGLLSLSCGLILSWGPKLTVIIFLMIWSLLCSHQWDVFVMKFITLCRLRSSCLCASAAESSVSRGCLPESSPECLESKSAQLQSESNYRSVHIKTVRRVQGLINWDCIFLYCTGCYS